MGEMTEGLRKYWNVDDVETAKHERVTVPKQPETWADDYQHKENIEHIKFFGEPKRILDFGCGVGRISRQFLKYGHEIYGVDVAPNMLKFAEEHCKPMQAKWILSDGYTLDIPDEFMQGAYSFYVFQHMPTWDMLEMSIKEIHRVLAINARFILQTIDDRGTIERNDTPDCMGVNQPLERIQKLLKNTGFDIVDETVKDYPTHRYILLRSIKDLPVVNNKENHGVSEHIEA